MPQQPAEVSPPPSPEQPLMQETLSVIHATDATIVPPTGVMTPEDSPQPRKKNWVWHLISRHPVPLVFAALIIIAGGFLSLAFASNSDVHYAAHEHPFDKNGVAILGDVFQFDWLGTQKVSVAWFIIGCGEYRLHTDGPSNDYLPVNRAVDVYLDDTSKPAFSFDPARLPMTKTGGKFRLHSLFSFGNEHSIEIGDQYHTPFDSYTFSAFVFAIERDTNKSIPITSFLVGDTGPADFTTTSSWVPSVNKFTNDTQAGSTIVEVESSTLFAEIRHSTRAQALTISMFAINWVLTLCSMVITSIVFNWWGEVRDGVALLPVTIILSIPAIRNLYVGSPPFGVFFDVVGFFPQMLIVVVCTMMILFVFTMRSIRNRDVAHEKGEFQMGASQLPLV